MKRYFLRLLLSLNVILIVANSGFGDWTQVGGSLNADTTKMAGYPSIATVDNRPFVAWHEKNNLNKLQVYVKEYTQSNWVQVGTTLNIDANQEASGPRIVFNKNTPYVIWSESSATASQVYLKKHNGTSWELVGGGSMNVDVTDGAVGASVAFGGSTPFAVWLELTYAPYYQVYVKHLDGVNWVQDGGNLASSTTDSAGSASIAVVNNTPYVAFSEHDSGTNRFLVYVKHFNGTDWVQNGGSLNVDSNKNAWEPKIYNSNGTIYVVWYESNISGVLDQIFVKYFNGANWVQVGGSLNVEPLQEAETPNVVFVGNQPYVTWYESSAGEDQVFVKHYNGSAWVQDGSSLNINTNYYARFPAVASLQDLDLYTTWVENNSSGIQQIRVKKLDVNPFISGVVPGNATTGNTKKIDIFGINLNENTILKMVHMTNGQEITAYNIGNITAQYIRGTFDFGPLNSIGKYRLSIQRNENIGISSQIFLLTHPTEPPAMWQVGEVGFAEAPLITNNFSGVSVGDGDNNGDFELFCTNRSRNIYRFIYSGSNWVKSNLPVGGAGEIFTTLSIRDGDNDGLNEVYAGSVNHYIYKFAGAVWTREDVGNAGDAICHITIGDATGDGYNKIYAASADGHIYQFIKSGNWIKDDLGAGVGEMYFVVLGDGNNDDQIEIYGANQDRTIYQFKYNGSIWNKTSIGLGADSMYGIAIGDPDKDGVNEIYSACGDGKIYRFRWNSSWIATVIGTGGGKMFSLVLGDADNNGSEELYGVCENGHIYSYSWINNQWETNDLGLSTSVTGKLSIGDSDNNNRQELCGITSDYYVRKWEYESLIPTPTPLKNFEGRIIDPDYIYAAPNPVRGHYANIVIFTNESASITAKLFTTTNREVFSFDRNYSKGQHAERINISNLANGVYLLLVKAKSDSGTEEKVIKKIAIVK
jgi:hypothetical protein